MRRTAAGSTQLATLAATFRWCGSRRRGGRRRGGRQGTEAASWARRGRHAAGISCMTTGCRLKWGRCMRCPSKRSCSIFRFSSRERKSSAALTLPRRERSSLLRAAARERWFWLRHEPDRPAPGLSGSSPPFVLVECHTAEIRGALRPDIGSFQVADDYGVDRV